MSNPIPEKLLELLKEAKENGSLQIEVIPIRNTPEEDTVSIPLSEFEDLIRDQTSLELLLLLHKDFTSYEFAKVVEAVKTARNVVSVADQLNEEKEVRDE